MSSSLFSKQNKMPTLMQMATEIKNGNPEAIFQQMYERNPQFKRFIDENKGLPIEDIARKYGIPL